MKRIYKILILSVLLVFLNSTVVFAYKLTGTKWSSATMPVDWKMNTAGSVDVGFSASRIAVENAFNTWQATSSYITFNYAGSTSSTNFSSYNGENLMVWYENNWTGETGRPSSTIAVCRYWYVSGVTVDSDIAFNGENYTWSATGEGGKMDIENLGAHEIGHFLGLGDLYSGGDSEKTMYGYGSNGETKKQTLHSDDISGINALYPGGYPVVASNPAGDAFSWNDTNSSYPWTDIAVGDFDGDGNDEVAVIRNVKATWGSQGYPVVVIDPGEEMTWDNTLSSQPWSRITAGDFDGDGDDEIAVIRNAKATWGSQGYPIVILDPGGEMTWDNTTSGYAWTDIAAGDFDGDGDDEIVVIRNAKASWGSRGYPIVVIDPGGEMTWDNTVSGYPWSRITAGDFDGDGDDEIAVIRNAKATWGSKGFPVIAFDPGGEMTWDNTSSGYVWTDLASGDLDGDGDDEIAVLRNAKATWGSLGYPIVALDPGGELTWDDSTSGKPWSNLAIGDLDGDAGSDEEIATVRNYRASW